MNQPTVRDIPRGQIKAPPEWRLGCVKEMPQGGWTETVGIDSITTDQLIQAADNTIQQIHGQNSQPD